MVPVETPSRRLSSGLHAEMRFAGAGGWQLVVDGTPELTVAEGHGVVNALDLALRKALLPFYPEIADVSLVDYKVRILDGHDATAAKTRVLIVSTDGHRNWGTVGVSDNIIEASWLALVDGIDLFLQRSKTES